MPSSEINDLIAWLALYHTPGIGSRRFLTLLDAFDSPDQALMASTTALQQAGLSQKLADAVKTSASALEKKSGTFMDDLNWLENGDNRDIITLHTEAYPPLLKRIADPPPILYVQGKLELLSDPQLAIVGSRNPTRGGLNNAREFAAYLGTNGMCITSGLALGIDGAAHEGALMHKQPTIAIVATGLDRVYPAKHRDLAHKITEQGAIISEFPIGTQPRAEHFPRRNRIISGLSYGTLVVEAALNSGSLITAHRALEQSREVFAIPGSIHNPLAKGCHQLIKQGGKLVETAQDILEELSAVIDLSTHQTVEHTDLPTPQDSMPGEISNNEEYQQLLTHMAYDPISIDELVKRSGFSAEAIATMLLTLELNNLATSTGGGYYLRIC